MSARRTAMKKRASTEPRPAGLLRRLSRRGQAMVEYSIITHFILIGGVSLMLPLIVRLYDGLSKYFEGIYFVLSSGAI